MKLTRENTTVGVMDMQVREKRNAGSLSHAFERCEDNICMLLESARAAGIQIVHIGYDERPNSPHEMRGPIVLNESNINYPYGASDENSEDDNGYALLPKFLRPGDTLIWKNGKNLFAGGKWKWEGGIFGKRPNIILSGIWTESCIEESAIGGKDCGYHMIIPRETTLGSRSWHARVLSNLAETHGSTVLLLEKTLKVMKGEEEIGSVFVPDGDRNRYEVFQNA